MAASISPNSVRTVGHYDVAYELTFFSFCRQLDTKKHRWAARHTNIIHAFAKVSQHGSAVEWLDVMEEAHHSPNVLSYTCAIEAGRWELGLEAKPLNRWIFLNSGMPLGHSLGWSLGFASTHAEARSVVVILSVRDNSACLMYIQQCNEAGICF